MNKQSDILEEIKRQAEIQKLKVSINNGKTNILTSGSFVTGMTVSTFRKAGDVLAVVTTIGEEQEDGTCKLIGIDKSNAFEAATFSMYLTWSNLDGSVQLGVEGRICLRQLYKLSVWTNPKAILDDVVIGAYTFGYNASAYIKRLSVPLDNPTITGSSLYIEMHDEFEPRANNLYRMMCEYTQKKKESDKADMINLLKEIKSHCPNASFKVEEIRKVLEDLIKEKVEL